MKMPSLLSFFIVASLLWEVFSLYLSKRQARYVTLRRDKVPAAFTGVVTVEEHRKAADYTVANAKLQVLSGLAKLAATLFLVLGVLDWLDRGIDHVFAPSVGHDVALFAAVSVLTSLVNLPFKAYKTFSINGRFGFNRSTPGLFVVDLVKHGAVAAVIGLPLLTALFWAMRNLTGLWWLYAWMGLVVIMLLAPAVYTRLVAPLFNKFEPLKDPVLAERIDTLLTRCGFRSSGLFTMDASKRSTQGNAFFIGFGRSKRIVLFDTLLDKQSPVEVEAVVAHELGHFKHMHVLFGLVRGAAMAFVFLAGIGWLCKQPWLLEGFGFEHHDPAMAFLAANMTLGLIAPLFTPLWNWISRRNEFQADDYARAKVGAEPMISALTRLSRDNAATLTPDPIYALVNYSHPPVSMRVAHLRRAAA
jgi:STE24 endopeptidase